MQVEDDGPGVPTALRASIFYPLVTGRSTGTGLGLAVAQDLVTRHGGLIEFESEPGRTVFKLMLPARGTRMSTLNLRVWLVDDDASIRWVLERALRNGGMLPRTFDAAEPALTALRGDAPDVLITDIRMSGQSGLELLKRIRETRPTLPVIVMTAYADLGNAVSAYESGAFEYLPKPFDIDQAVDLVRRAARTSTPTTADGGSPPPIPELLGRAAAMQQVFRAIGRLSRSSVTVLITGESGTVRNWLRGHCTSIRHALPNHSLR